MLYKFLKKSKKFISFVIVLCIMVPFLSACGGELDNGVKESKVNIKIGTGGNIEAYTTYSSAPLKKMSQDLYYSYLMNYRPFILAVVPDNSVVYDSDGSVKSLGDNDMLGSIAAGVFQYNSSYTSFVEQDLKLLIYYVKASEFKSWEIEADAEDSFLRTAFDFTADNASDAEYNPRNFKCDKIVNMGNFLNAEATCTRKTSDAKWNSSIFNIGDTNDGKGGIILLYGEGSLEGYIKDSDIRNMDTEEYFRKLLPDNYNSIFSTINTMKTRLSNDAAVTNLQDAIDSEIYKMKFDIALWSRISHLNKYTKLDFSVANKSEGEAATKQDEFNNKYGIDRLSMSTSNDVSYDTMMQALGGKGEFSDSSYITLVTANGFIFDRGDIVAESMAALMSEDYQLVLEELMRMDSCPNETLAKKILDIVAGGALFAGGAILITTIFVMPFPGARIVGAVLLLAGLIYYAITSGSAATAEDYCQVFRDALSEVKKSSILSIPILSYNIEKSSPVQTVSIDNKIPLYYYANREKAEKMELSGSPYLGFYYEGQLVDSIYGAADITFITEILSSWGVLVTAENKYFSNYDASQGSIYIYDRGRTDNERTSIKYCYSLSYGANVDEESCLNGVKNFASGNTNNYGFNSENGFTYVSSFAGEDLSGYASNAVSSEISGSRIDFNAIMDEILNLQESDGVDGIKQKLQKLLDEVDSKSNYNTATIKSKIDYAIKMLDKTDIYYLEDQNGGKYFLNNGIGSNSFKLLDGKYYKFIVSENRFQNTETEELYDVIAGEVVIGDYTYNLYSFGDQVGAFGIKKNGVVALLEKELQNIPYYSRSVNIYINILVTEKTQANSITPEEKAALNCELSEVRRNKVWGNYLCVNDLKWYHIKSNWKKLEMQTIMSTTSTTYKIYNVELKFGV